MSVEVKSVNKTVVFYFSKTRKCQNNSSTPCSKCNTYIKSYKSNKSNVSGTYNFVCKSYVQYEAIVEAIGSDFTLFGTDSKTMPKDSEFSNMLQELKVWEFRTGHHAINVYADTILLDTKRYFHTCSGSFRAVIERGNVSEYFASANFIADAQTIGNESATIIRNIEESVRADNNFIVKFDTEIDNFNEVLAFAKISYAFYEGCESNNIIDNDNFILQILKQIESWKLIGSFHLKFVKMAVSEIEAYNKADKKQKNKDAEKADIEYYGGMFERINVDMKLKEPFYAEINIQNDSLEIKQTESKAFVCEIRASEYSFGCIKEYVYGNSLFRPNLLHSDKIHILNKFPEGSTIVKFDKITYTDKEKKNLLEGLRM